MKFPAKTLKLEVELRFTKPIAESDVQEVVENVMHAIASHVETTGVAPEAAEDTFTEAVKATCGTAIAEDWF
jgi:hypothetical protein